MVLSGTDGQDAGPPQATSESLVRLWFEPPDLVRCETTGVPGTSSWSLTV
jgi:hypothetical protein